MKSIRIHERLQEADTEDIADRLGQWWKDIDPNAGPGKKGYMRKRNVPPLSGPASKYDPTKHERPTVKGQPLKYMQPQHMDYTRAHIRSRVLKSASREGEKGEPKKGNINKNFKIGKAIMQDKHNKGREILAKHGVPNPSIPQMAVKWTAGNSPRSKYNPEGYVRSDHQGITKRGVTGPKVRGIKLPPK
tara:strand:+ start:4108 stop:4674 length:567 start_codon:yes stop_codon:yes gene_type:complete